MSDRAADVIVVGAGIVGAACAEALSRDGIRVTVIDARAAGTSGATAAGMGHVVVMDDSEAQFALTRHSRDLWESVAGEMPPDVEYDRCGSLWVAADAEEMNEVRRKHAYYAQRGVATEILDERQLYDAEPNLRPGLAGGLRVPGEPRPSRRSANSARRTRPSAPATSLATSMSMCMGRTPRMEASSICTRSCTAWPFQTL